MVEYILFSIRISLKNIILFCVFLFLVACKDEEFIINGKTMGTTYIVKSSQFIDKKIIDNELIRINKIFSNWDKNSEIERFNRLSINTTFFITADFVKLIKLSKIINKQTNNYFDIGIGNLIDIWGFGTQQPIKKPTQNTIQNALNNSGIKYLEIIDNKIKKYKNIKLNLSAIAKGYGVDRVIQILLKQGVKNGLVEIGGEVRVIGKKNIGIEQIGKTPIKIILNNEAIATSGDYRNYRIFNNEKFIHILNPKTGLPSKSDLISVSIIHKNTATADGFATALLAMGKNKAIKIIKKNRLKSVLIDKNNIITYYNLNYL